MYKNKSILITGGTGTFGKEFVKFLIKQQAKKIVIFSRDEQKQFHMQQDKIYQNCLFYLGDIRDYDRFLLASKNIDYIVHAAALKIVPSLEFNPMESVKTNILGSNNVFRASLENNVKKVVFLSTDKAVNPVNLYGACKMTAEKVCIQFNNLVGNKNTRFSVVRYGNVSGSRGSLVDRLNHGEKLSLTNKNMTRFWISASAAVESVNYSLNKMIGGEIFVPKVPSVRIKDLFDVIYSKKYSLSKIRPGEKIHEVLLSKEESAHTVETSKYFIILPENKFLNIKQNYYKIHSGKKISKIFDYSSGDNKNFLSNLDIKNKLFSR